VGQVEWPLTYGIAHRTRLGRGAEGECPSRPEPPYTSHANDTRDGTPTLAVPAVGVAGRYSNRHDLLEQHRKVAAILSEGCQDNDAGAEAAPQSVVRSRRLRDRFSLDDLQTMISTGWAPQPRR
jgi:hypothetical protein